MLLIKQWLTIAAAGFVASCAHAATNSDEGALSGWSASMRDPAIGRIYYYVRSNSDMTQPERITVFRKSEDEVHVFKAVERCYRAAYVTAKLDLEAVSAEKITGGQLMPDAQVFEFAFLTWNREAEKLDVLVKLPNGELVEEAPVILTPWHLFDFDLSSLTVMTPYLTAPEKGFSFGMALLWADPTADDPATWMGAVTARYTNDTNLRGSKAMHYQLTGSAFKGPRSTGEQGDLWLDKEEGHIVEAKFPAPNHPGYTDFALRLESVSDAGEDEWGALLKAHYENCE